MTAAATALPGARASGSPWFRSAAFDAAFLLGVPFLTWPLVMLAQGAWGPELVGRLILLTATGHYFATFVRTYGDRALFARFKTRFLVAPALLAATCIAMFASGREGALGLVTAGWAFWHWLAQAFGFARIYDIKAGSFRPLTAWLDKALVITGFVGVVTLDPGSTATFAKLLLDAGIPLPGAVAFAIVQRVVLGAIVLVGAAYLGNLGVTLVRGQPWSWQKQVMHVTTIGYYWFAFAYLPNVLVAYVLYELFHDIQYYAITWLTCRQRVQRPDVAPWLALMFRPGRAGTLAFLLLMSGIGAADMVARRDAPSLTPLFLSFALLHYYYDGFVWKAREKTLGADLGIQGGLRAAVVPGLRHAASWALFFVPLLLVAAFGKPTLDPRTRAEALVALAPRDFLSQAELGYALATSRELPAALEHYRASVTAWGDYAQARVNYGAALELAGELGAAREQYLATLRCRDQNGSHARAHVNLGALLLADGDKAAALEHLHAGRQLGGEDPIGRLLGMAGAVANDDVARRTRLYSAVLELDSGQADAHFNLGNLDLALGRPEPAARHFEAVLQRAPDFVPGLVGLAAAQAALGKLEPARQALSRALQREPTNAQALALQSRLTTR